jgi:hypothetical protein
MGTCRQLSLAQLSSTGYIYISTWQAGEKPWKFVRIFRVLVSSRTGGVPLFKYGTTPWLKEIRVNDALAFRSFDSSSNLQVAMLTVSVFRLTLAIFKLDPDFS